MKSICSLDRRWPISDGTSFAWMSSFTFQREKKPWFLLANPSSTISRSKPCRAPSTGATNCSLSKSSYSQQAGQGDDRFWFLGAEEPHSADWDAWTYLGDTALAAGQTGPRRHGQPNAFAHSRDAECWVLPVLQLIQCDHLYVLEQHTRYCSWGFFFERYIFGPVIVDRKFDRHWTWPSCWPDSGQWPGD